MFSTIIAFPLSAGRMVRFVLSLRVFSAALSVFLKLSLLTTQRYGGNKLLNRMYELVRQIWEEERIPEEPKKTIIVSIHKRGDRDRCENYRGIALGNAAYIILSNIILGKIKPHIEKVMGDYQNGFRDGRSVTDNIFALKIINEKLWEYNQSVRYVFIDCQKVYDYT